MTDTIGGNVTKVIDGDTFEMDVTRRGGNNQNEYGDHETVRMANTDAPELDQPGGEEAKEALEIALVNADVECEVQARDEYGRVVADVKTTS